jgi:phospholipase C
VSAYARAHYIDHATLDFTSMLKFIEQNWRLRPLTTLDARAGSIMGAFDFAQPPRKAEIIPLQRFTPPPPPRRVRDATLYGLYGIGVLFALGLVVAAALRPVRRRRNRAVTLRSEGEAT